MPSVNCDRSSKLHKFLNNFWTPSQTLRIHAIGICKSSFWVLQWHIHHFHQVNQTLPPPNEINEFFRAFPTQGCSGKNLWIASNLVVTSPNMCEKTSIFLDALASLDLKLSVGEWLIFLQLAHLRVIQIIFDVLTWIMGPRHV